MKKIIFILIALTTFTSCLVEPAQNGGVDSDKLRNYSHNLLVYLSSDVGVAFTRLMAVDSYEALPEAEKSNALYNAFRVTQIWEDGFKSYEGYGRVLTDTKRLADIGSLWASGNLSFKCDTTLQGDTIWEYSIIDKSSDMRACYLPGEAHLWIESGGSLCYEFRAEERGENGYTSVFYTITPVKFDLNRFTSEGRYRLETYKPNGDLYDWVEITDTPVNITYKTSRD